MNPLLESLPVGPTRSFTVSQNLMTRENVLDLVLKGKKLAVRVGIYDVCGNNKPRHGNDYNDGTKMLPSCDLFSVLSWAKFSKLSTCNLLQLGKSVSDVI